MISRCSLELHINDARIPSDAVAFKLFDISAPDDLDLLVDYLDEVYEPQLVVDRLKSGLDPRCKKVLLESYYNDKDYRSTYYHYYAKKGYRYEINCARLHFFDERVSLLPDFELRFSITEPQKPSNTYFGYMVLRPTRQSTIGRTVIAPSAIKSFHGCVIEANHKVHLLGHKLTVAGFPYMTQHTDISVCAHATCWTILRHYSERFPKYAEFLTFDITRMAHEFDPGGIVPSNGLHVGHAERVFASAGTYPVLIVRDSNSPNAKSFLSQLLAYVESGFPLFAEVERIEHAVAVIGHTGFTETIGKSAPCHFAYDTVKGLVVVDDNSLPYLAIDRLVGTGDEYGCDDITAFIVALPEKVYYPAEYTDSLAVVLATEEHLGFDHAELGEPIVRYFLTTAAHLRSFMHKQRSQFDPVLVQIVMQLSLPQFVWVIEIASQDQWRNGTIATRVIVDATASAVEQLPIFLMHDAERAYVWDRGDTRDEQYVKLVPPASAPLSRMDGDDGNLVTH